MLKRFVLLNYIATFAAPARLRMRPVQKLRQDLCTESDIRQNVKDCKPSVCTVVYDPLAPHDDFYETGCWARESLPSPIPPPKPRNNPQGNVTAKTSTELYTYPVTITLQNPDYQTTKSSHYPTPKDGRTRSTLAPMDNGDRTTKDTPSMKSMCNGLALCVDVIPITGPSR